VFDVASAGADAGIVGIGPRIGDMAFINPGTNNGTLRLSILLAPFGTTPPTPSPVFDKTFIPSFVSLNRLDSSTGWQPVAVTPTLDVNNSNIDIVINSGLSADRYRLVIDPPFATPITDDAGRPLQPLHFARFFALVLDTTLNVLKLAPAF
jgi:hypothetical protein